MRRITALLKISLNLPGSPCRSGQRSLVGRGILRGLSTDLHIPGIVLRIILHYMMLTSAQIYGEEEKIYGYQDLVIDVSILSLDLFLGFDPGVS